MPDLLLSAQDLAKAFGAAPLFEGLSFGIFDGDHIVVRVQADAESGDIVVAGIPGEEATVKTLIRKRGKVILRPANPALTDMVFEPGEVSIYGRVVTVLRKL